MDALVDSLFLFSKLDTGQFPFKFNIVNVNEYLRDFFKCAKKEFYGKEVEISFLSECDTSTEVKLDSQEMYRVLLNILDNSVKYNKNRKLKIEISLYDKGDLIELILSDNGSGVQEEDIPKLFLSFYRGDASRTKPNEGSGLGLAIAKHIIEAHDGQIIAYNKEGLSIKIILPKNYKKNI